MILPACRISCCFTPVSQPLVGHCYKFRSCKMAARIADTVEDGSREKTSQGELVQAALFRAPSPGVVDIGCNLVDRSFEKDRHEVIARAVAANVTSMIVTGTCIRTANAARKVVDQSKTYPLFFTAGVHPHNAKSCDSQTIATLREMASHDRCVAIGECGLDFNRNFSPQDVQVQWFDQQITLAKELQKPLFMHCRDAADMFSEVLSRHLPLICPGVVHCFTGNEAELRRFLEMGLYIGITGWVCDERQERGGAQLAALLPLIPPDRLMIETDAPYLVPRTIRPSKDRPRRNEPALLPHVLRAVAQATGRSEEAVAQQTSAVVAKVFGAQVVQPPAR